MLKRMLAAEPVAPAAEWSRRSAAFALVLAVFGILLGAQRCRRWDGPGSRFWPPPWRARWWRWVLPPGPPW